MSQENVDIALRLFAAVAERDLDALLDLTDPEVRWRSFFAALTEGGEYHGHAGLTAYINDLDEAFEVLRPAAWQLLDVGEVVVGVGQIHYRGRGSGVEADVAAGWLMKFRSGKLVLFRAFQDPEQALEAVGLRD